MPGAAIALVWSFIFQSSSFGLFNGVLGYFGIPAQPWLNSSRLVIPSLIIIGVWRSLGYNLVIYLAGLSGIPTTFYEAARIDGANGWQMFWKITWPLLFACHFILGCDRLYRRAQIFDIPYIMTARCGRAGKCQPHGGNVGPESGLSGVPHGLRFGAAFIFFFIILALTIAQLRFLRTKWSY